MRRIFFDTWWAGCAAGNPTLWCTALDHAGAAARDRCECEYTAHCALCTVHCALCATASFPRHATSRRLSCVIWLWLSVNAGWEWAVDQRMAVHALPLPDAVRARDLGGCTTGGRHAMCCGSGARNANHQPTNQPHTVCVLCACGYMTAVCKYCMPAVR